MESAEGGENVGSVGGVDEITIFGSLLFCGVCIVQRIFNLYYYVI